MMPLGRGRAWSERGKEADAVPYGKPRPAPDGKGMFSVQQTEMRIAGHTERKGGRKMQDSFDTIIVGGGAAGYTAAIYLARGGLHTLLLERQYAGGQMALTGRVENYPGFPEGIDGAALGLAMQKGAERFGAVTVYDEVLHTAISGEQKRVFTKSQTFCARSVILATGADPRRLEVAQEGRLLGHGLHYCAHCDGAFYRGRTVVVVGGGNAAVSDALYLSTLAEHVYLVHRGASLRAEPRSAAALQASSNVTLVWNGTVFAILGENAVRGVRLRHAISGAEEELACDGVFVSIGRTPATGFLRGAVALDDQGYILADETTKTSIPGVFAAGDVRRKPLRQIVTAVADGAVAAHYAAQFIGAAR